MDSQDAYAAADSAFFSQLESEARFYIMRHGQSEGNARAIFQGRLDLPLDETGRAQARAAGGWLAKKGIRTMFASPLLRAAETARIAAAPCGLDSVTYDPLFSELDVGIFTGIGFDEARHRHPDVFRAFEGESWDAVPEAEKSEALYERAMRCWALMRERALAGDKAIACVSHGGFIQWLVRATFGCRSWMPLLHTANCGIFELIVRPTAVSPEKPMDKSRAYLQWKQLNYQVPSA
jgi:broad specificity phosphatase PhoE